MEKTVNSPRQRKKKKKTGLYIILALLLIVYLFVQWYLINRNKTETVKATEGYLNDSIKSVGYVCKDEIIVSDSYTGYFYYNIENGQRISAGSLIGEAYPSANDINLLFDLIEISNQIENLKDASQFMSTVNADISQTRKDLSLSLAQLSEQLSADIYKNVSQISLNATLNLNKINVAMSREGDLNSAIENLTNLKSSVEAQISQPTSSIQSPASGYFINSIDGFENTLNIDSFKNMSYNEGMEILSSPVESSSAVCGKIVTSYKWYLCTYVTSEDAAKLYKGQSVQLSLDSSENKYQKATVESVTEKEDGMFLVVLESSSMNLDAASIRISQCEILFSQYKGIKIPKESLRIIDGEMGVFVQFSKLVQFKKVSPIYQDDNYMILPLNGDSENQVELYDNVIVKGVNLYDGKYL